MCGICGIYNYAGNSALAAIEAGVLVRMRDTLIHRGPDDKGIYLSEDRNVGLGHRRLSIIDLSSEAKQPMPNENETVWIVYNGEIYNYKEIRVRLERRGHFFRTQGDTEVIIHLYEEMGIDCLALLQGMFSFAIWDSRKKCLLLVRDRLGVKPLYYADKHGIFIFGSEPKALLEHPLISRGMDFAALSQYLTFNAVPAPRTLFGDVQKMRPGTVLTVSSNGIEEKCFWDLPVRKARPYETEAFYLERIRELFRAATKKRMVSDVPFGAFLSGGIDSSLNVAYMAEILQEPVNTFTIGFGGNGIRVANELDKARLVAARYQSHHRELVVTSQDILESLPNVIHHLDDPIGTPTPISNFHAAKLVRKSGVTVAQVGEGSDEIFVGYPQVYSNVRSHRFWLTYGLFPQALKRAFFAMGMTFLPRLGNPAFSDSTDSPILEMLRRAAFRQDHYWGFGNCFSEIDKSFLLSEAFRSNCPGPHPYELVNRYYGEFDRKCPHGDYTQRVTYVDLKISLAERLLMRVDKMTMAFSVEARVPFLDHELVEFVVNIPQSVKLKSGAKYILKKACEGVIPDEIIHRPKMGFPTPINIYLSPEIRGFVLDRIFNSSIHRLDVFSLDYIRRIVQMYDQGRKDYFFLIWNLFTLAYWYDYWVEGVRG